MSYKYTGDINELSVTQTNFGKFVGLTQQRISQMVADNELIRDESDKAGRLMLAASLREFYLSKKASGDNVSYWKEKALREKANRELDELKLQKLRSEVYEAKDIEAAWIEILTVLKNNLLGLPSKFAVRCEHKSKEEIFSLLTEEIETLLSQLSRAEG